MGAASTKIFKDCFGINRSGRAGNLWQIYVKRGQKIGPCMLCDFASLQFFQGAITMPAPGIVERVFFKLHVRHC